MARQLLVRIDRTLMPAYLPLALVEPSLRHLEKPGLDPLRTPVGMMPWRRHLVLWRAVKRGRV